MGHRIVLLSVNHFYICAQELFSVIPLFSPHTCMAFSWTLLTCGHCKETQAELQSLLINVTSDFHQLQTSSCRESKNEKCMRKRMKNT